VCSKWQAAGAAMGLGCAKTFLQSQGHQQPRIGSA
jgi:hypothetical protein